MKKGNLKIDPSVAGDSTNQNKVDVRLQSFYELFDQLLDEVYLFDSKELKFIYVNKVAIENLGYSLEEMLSRTPLDLKKEYDANSFKNLLATLLLRKAKKQLFNAYFTRKDGSRYPVEIHLQLSSFTDIQSFLAIVIDITKRNENNNARERLFRQLENKEAQYRNLIANSPIGVMLVELHSGAFVNANQAFLDIFGYSLDDFKGLKIEDFVPEHLKNEREEQLMKLGKYGKITFETERIHKSGSLIPVESTLSMNNFGDTFPIIIAVVRDISDRKRKEEELKHNYRELEQFAYLAAHDLKAPVANLYILLTMLENDKGVKEQSMDLFEKIFTSVRQMQKTIKSLNEVIEVKKDLDLKFTEVYFYTVLTDVLMGINDLIKENGVKIDADFSLCKSVRFSPVHIHRILHNLITNSIKYRLDDKTPIIHISTKKENEAVCLIVKDNGKGIDLDSYGHKLFGQFQRFHLEVEGKGIGLHLTKAIVENNGGHIDVKSQPNKGAEFIVYLVQLENEKNEFNTYN